MSLVAERLKRLKPSATLAIAAKARQLKAEGNPVISMSAGEPDFDTPNHIKQAAMTAIQNGETKYTDVGGTPALKQAIINKFKRENNLTYTPDQIIAGVGAKHVLFNACMASLNPGDEVIIPAPFWVSYPEMVLVAEGVPVIVSCDEEQNFKLTPQQLAAAITPKTKWLLLNSPSNPTGALYSAAELRALADVLVKHLHVSIITDDMYEHLRYDGQGFATIAEVAPELYDRTLTVNGVSKSYAMTGWRIGFAGGPVELIKAMTMMQSHGTSNPPSMTQAAAIEALNGPQECVGEMRAVYEKRRDFMVAEVNKADGLSVTAPAGAFYLYINCEGMLGRVTAKGVKLNSEADVCQYLLEDYHLAVVPGEAFGLSPYFRVTFAASDDMIKGACQRMQDACAALKTNGAAAA